MRQHYNGAFALQAAGRFAESDIEHKLFLAEALHRVATGRANTGDYAGAAQVYDDALQCAPKDVSLHLEYAEAALDADDLAKAKAEALEALDLLPTSSNTSGKSEVLHVLARASWGIGDHKGSIEYHKAAVEVDPSFDNLYALATTYLSLSEIPSATAVFSKILAKLGDKAWLHLDFGIAYAIATDYSAAVRELKTAIAEDDRLPGAHYSLGAAYVDGWGAPAFSDAETEFRKELSIHPDDSLAYAQLGRIAISREDFKEAESDLTRASDLDPRNPGILMICADLYRAKDRTEDAILALRKAIADTIDPSHNNYKISRAHYQLGRLLIQRGELEEGKSELRVAQELSAKSNLQEQASMNGEPDVQSPLERTRNAPPSDKAEVARFEKQIIPAIASSYESVGVHAAIVKEYGTAVKCFKLAAKWDPSIAESDFNLGRAAFEAQEFSEAVGPLGRHLQGHPDDSVIRAELGISQYMIQKYAEALETLHQIEQHLDLLPLLSVAYAECIVRAGNREEEMERLQSLVRTHPENEAAIRALMEVNRRLDEIKGPNTMKSP